MKRFVLWLAATDCCRSHENLESFCAKKLSDLKGLIWSHRGRRSSTEIDGNLLAIEEFLDAGVVNFDLDVSIVASSAKGQRFVVAHPSLVASTEVDQLLDVKDVLEHLQNESRSRNIKICTVTLEPKFDIVLLPLLFHHLSAFNGLNIALIANKPERFLYLLSLLEQGEVEAKQGFVFSVAFAFRPFNEKLSVSAWDGFLMEPTQQLSTAHLLMPEANELERFPACGRFDKSHPQKVVVWTVDSVEVALRAIESCTDGIITNRPLQLLKSLETVHRSRCAEFIVQ